MRKWLGRLPPPPKLQDGPFWRENEDRKCGLIEVWMKVCFVGLLVWPRFPLALCYP